MVDEVKAYVIYEIRKPDGKVKKRKTMKSDSLVANFLRIVKVCLTNEAENVIDANGNLFTVSPSDLPSIKSDAPEGDDKFGILLGTGTTEVSPNDYALESKIPHGDVDNSLHYYTSSHKSIVVDTATKKTTLDFIRDFQNKGTVNITISEVGLAVEIYPHYVLIFRHIIPSEERPTVSSNEYITFTVRIEITS